MARGHKRENFKRPERCRFGPAAARLSGGNQPLAAVGAGGFVASPKSRARVLPRTQVRVSERRRMASVTASLPRKRKTKAGLSRQIPQKSAFRVIQ